MGKAPKWGVNTYKKDIREKEKVATKKEEINTKKE